MPRQRKENKSLLEELRKTLHSLTKPKRAPRKARKRKTGTAGKTAGAASAPDNARELQVKLEKNLARKMNQDMQKMKRDMEQRLLKKLSKESGGRKKAETAGKKTNGRKTAEPAAGSKKSRFKKAAPSPSRTAVRVYRPESDCTLLKLLVLSDRHDRKVVVGYEVLDTSTQVIWGVDIHEGARLARNKKIRDTKARSRKAGSERQYYLVHTADDALYYSDAYAKAAIEEGKLTVVNYTAGLAEAVRNAYEAGYTNNSEWPGI
ncbi:hypothetical protein [Paenibacillus humicola]|uniref:hypothetical protein n=1 Tax=Paenibacillus humicola TaxID=3110540 RepID=UPI00237BD4B7|nr:hypothetical protein [Paenibacillus humicola]